MAEVFIRPCYSRGCGKCCLPTPPISCPASCVRLKPLTTPRNTRVRDSHRRTIARGKPACAICGEEIDYSLRYPDPGCFVVDHVYPRAKGGNDDLGNKQPAHNKCNRLKSDKVADDERKPAARVFVTSRQW